MTVMLGVVAVAVAVFAVPNLTQQTAARSNRQSVAAAQPASRSGNRGAGTPSASTSPAGPVYSLTGDFPKSGPGTFTFDKTQGKVLGTAGTLQRFRVGIEQGVPENLATFSKTIDQTLGDPRSWTASKQLRLQRMPDGADVDFTIYLATEQTAKKMCGQGGVDITVDNEPYTSCRSGPEVVLNLSRWRLSVPGYIQNKVPLSVYREYVINHEVGHALGHGHELCPGNGKPAPTMQQQTLSLLKCTANPWPYLDGERYAGPPGSIDGSGNTA